MYTFRAGEPVNSFLWSLLNHDKVSRFVKEEEWRQVFLAWSKNYLGLTRSSDWQISNFTQEPGETHLLGEVISFRKFIISLFQAFWPWRSKYVIISWRSARNMEDGALVKWIFSKWFTRWAVPWIWYSIEFKNELAPIIMAISVSNACVERIFSVMGWKVSVVVESLRSKLCVIF